MATTQLDFGALKVNPNLKGPVESRVIDILAAAISSTGNVEERAKVAASQTGKIQPADASDEGTGDEAGGPAQALVYQAWMALLAVVQLVPPDHVGQEISSAPSTA